MNRLSGRTHFVVALIILTALVAPMTGAVRAAPARATITLHLLRWFGECSSQYQGVTNPAKGVDECSEIQILTNKWNAEHPSTPVQTEVIDGGTWDTRFAAEFASGAPPDVTIIHGSSVPRYARAGVLTPLRTPLAQAGVNLNDFVPTAINYASYRNTLYAMPFDIHTLIWYINVDLFKKAGLVDSKGNARLPQSEAQFLADARIMKQKTGKQFVQAQTIDADLGTDWNFDAFMAQQKAPLFSGGFKTPTFDNAAGLKSLNFWYTLIKSGYTSPSVKDTNSMFLNGDVASIMNGTWAVNQFGTEVKTHKAAFSRMEIVPFPKVFAKAASWSDSHAWAIPKQPHPNAARTKAAIAFLRFLYDNDFNWSRTGHLSVRKSVLKSKAYARLPYRSQYARAARIAIPMPRILPIADYESILHEDILAVYLGQKSPKDALADAQKRVQEAIINSP
ncbi:MAG: extracellular solute-binding protein [Chloroflexi bacterium]|nr:extracellular solute-binding protein [Chloroflexota bacterium]